MPGVTDDRFHAVLGHQLQLLELAHAPLLVRRERGVLLQRLELRVVPVVLGAEAPKLLVLGRKSFDQSFPVHAGLLDRCGDVSRGKTRGTLGTKTASVLTVAGSDCRFAYATPVHTLLVAGTPLIALPPRGCQEQRFSCSEHIICPVPRAREVSALAATRRSDRANQGGGDALRRGRSGAGHEDAGSHLAGAQRGPDLDSGGRDPRPRSAQLAPLAGAL